MVRPCALILLPLSFLLLLSIATPTGMAQRDISRDSYLPRETLFSSAPSQPDGRPILIPSRPDTMAALRTEAPSGMRPRFELLNEN